MNYSNYRFTLDMQSNISQVSLPVRLLDTSRRLYISLTDGGSPYTIANGCRAVFYARKADGKPIMNDCIIEKNTLIRYDLTQQTTTCAGVVDCEVRLYGTDGKLITSPRFIMVVDERVVYDDDFPLSEAEQTILDNIILSETARASAEEERQQAHEEMLASTQKANETTAEIERKLANGDFIGGKGDKGDIGDSGVHIGTEEPTDPDAIVWVNPLGEETKVGVHVGPKAPTNPGIDVWLDPNGDFVIDLDIAGKADAAIEAIEANEEDALNKIVAAKDDMLKDIELAADIVQTTGNSATAVMSQKAVTDYIGDNFANAIKGYAKSNGTVVVDDVSPIKHNMKVKLKSKNLLSYPYYETTKTANGVTFTDNGDGSITVNGTPTKDTTFFLFSDNSGASSLNIGEDAMLSANSGGGYYDGYYITASYKVGNGAMQYLSDGGSGVAITSEKTVTGIYIVVKSGIVLNNITFYPQLERGMVVTEYEPYVDVKTANVIVPGGKNLLSYPYYETTKTANGVTFTDNKDGSITVNGTPTTNTNFVVFTKGSGDFIKFDETVMLCANSGGGYYDGYYMSVAYNIGDGATQYLTEPGTGVAITSEKAINGIFIVARQGYAINNVTFYPQIEYGTIVTEHEPYRESVKVLADTYGVASVPSVYPSTTIHADKKGVIMDVEYNRDINQNNLESVLTIEGASWEE